MINIELNDVDVILRSTSPEEATMLLKKQVELVNVVLATTAMPRISKQYFLGFVSYVKDYIRVMEAFVYDPKVISKPTKTKKDQET